MDPNNPNAEVPFKCLTKPDPTHAHHPVHIKQRFNKLTLSSSNKKPKPVDSNVRSILFAESSLKMLNFSSDSATLSSDEDEAVPLGNKPSAAAPISNCLLVSSSDTLPPAADEKNGRVSKILSPCEAPTFSQRLELSDADETNCTMLDNERLPSIYAADTLIHNPEADKIQELTLGTQMDKLQITAESEDLFDDTESSGYSKQHNQKLGMDAGIVAAQNVLISSLSQGLEKLELADTLNISVLTISSSSSVPAAPAQVSTRSSLGSEDVYDVITLSDSDDVQNEPNQDPNLGQIEDSLERNMTPLNSQTIMPVSSELSEMALNRLDRFFDNIPLMSSANSPNPPVVSQSVNHTRSEVAETTVSSVYISETDDENERVDQPMENIDKKFDGNKENPNGKDYPKAINSRIPVEPMVEKDDSPIKKTREVAQSPVHEFVQNTETTQITKLTKSSKNSNRTPIVNISAKFQIRIQVAAPNDSSSECSSSNHSSSAPTSSGNTSQHDTPVDKVTNRISEMCIISDSNSGHDSDTNNTDSHFTTTAKDRCSLESPKSHQTMDSAKCTTGLGDTPKSTSRKLQLGKLKTPKAPAKNAIHHPASEASETLDSPRSPKKTVVLSDAEQRLLNELYGTSWQTPELMKKCVLPRKVATQARIQSKIRKPIRNYDSNGNEREASHGVSEPHEISRNSQDFSIFRKNIANHLDSTRIDEIEPAAIKDPTTKPTTKDDVSVVNSPFFQKQSVAVMSPTLKKTKLAASRRLDDSNTSPLPTRSVRKKKPLQIIDSDLDDSDHQPLSELSSRSGRSVRKCRTNTNKQYDVTDDDDEEEPKIANSSSDNDWEEATEIKNRSKPSVLKKKTSNELTYLDLTHSEVIEDEDHQAPNASDQDLEELSHKLLESFEFKKPNQFEFTTPASAVPPENTNITAPKTTKRKLFTPYFDDMQQANDEIYNKHDITAPTNLRQTLMNVMTPSLRDGPEAEVASINFRKALPKFLQLPTNRRIEDLQRKELVFPPESPKSDATVTKKASTPKSQRKTAKDTGFKTLPTCVADIPVTPDNKYGFLRSFDVEISKKLLHPTALMFRDSFKTKKDDLAHLLYALYNSRVFDGKLDVPVTWNKKLNTTAGYCYSRQRGGIRSAAIDLSDKVVTSADRLRCTLIHELCHAATWIVNADRGHGTTWKAWARKANAALPDLPPIERCHAYDIEYKYTYQCTLCGAKSHAHSKSKKVELIRCAYCHGSIEIFLNKKTKNGAVCQTPVRKASGFAAFVKVEYKAHKLAGVTHADVMRQLSAKFAALSADEKKQY